MSHSAFELKLWPEMTVRERELLFTAPSFYRGICMADINIERKRPSIVPWLVGMILLVVAIWGAAEILDGGDNDVPPAAEVESVR